MVMSMSYCDKERWTPMAMIEVDEASADMTAIAEEVALEFELKPASPAPLGSAWLELRIDASKGEWRAARTAHVVLTALADRARDGRLPGFRIVSGEQWLRVDAPIEWIEPPIQALSTTDSSSDGRL
jgi:hypothetical protein